MKRFHILTFLFLSTLNLLAQDNAPVLEVASDLLNVGEINFQQPRRVTFTISNKSIREYRCYRN